jgi:phage shock protein PspC (stress-responsive transcriptional regulator)
MEKTITIGLAGGAQRYRLDEDAYARLSQYLERAEHRLQDDPDRTEVLGDLERSIGDRLSGLVATDDRLLTAADIDGVLEAIGMVDTGRDATPDEDPSRPRPRRLRRIREGQWLAGVCNGLAAYAELRVDWVRTLFLFATVLTAGAFGLVYVALAFILPVSQTRES